MPDVPASGDGRGAVLSFHSQLTAMDGIEQLWHHIQA